jgi:tripartite-type tricarboxylate transporter receptor subunit TctC
VRSVRLVVPYPAGGPLDIVARALAERVKDTLGTVIVENRPGAGGNLGADLVAKSAPDGNTLVMGAVATHAINPWLYAKMPYNAATDFAPITQMLRVPNVLVMNAETAQRLKINTLADLVAYAKANPAKLNFGSGGNGSAGHLAGEMFKRAAAFLRCTFLTTAATRRSWPCCQGKWTSTSTTWPQRPPTSNRADSKPWP